MPSIDAMAKFAGEGDAFVDALITACNAPRPSLEAPSRPELIGRELTPYFSADDKIPPLVPRKQAGRTSSTNASNKRKGSPPHASRPASGTSTPASPSAKHGKKSAPVDIAPAAQAKSPSVGAGRAGSAKAGRSEARSPVRSGRNSFSGSPMSTGVYACPGMFSSPKPEALPMPTSGILMRAAVASSFARANAVNACALVMA